MRRFWIASLSILLAGFSTAALAQSGVYVRGDAGLGFAEDATFKDTSPTAANCAICTSSAPAGMGTSEYIGVGIGYRINAMFRADLTLSTLPSLKGHGVTQGGNASGIKFSGNVASYVAMANGYLDINGFFPNQLGAFQPFVNFGLGFADNRVGTVNGVSAGGVTGSLTGASTTNFAWGIGAGVGYALSPAWTVELAYKYLNLGEMRTGTTAATFNGISGAVTALKSGDLTAHTLTAGLRYMF
jgi:opacity protein-like surface antigen